MSASAPILYESHCHTPLCQHAEGEPSEYAAAAERAGFKGIIFTCHCPLPDRQSETVRMSPLQYTLYHRMIAETREQFAGRVDVRVGLESDFYPGVEPWLGELHERFPLHHVLGSVHPQLGDYRRRYFQGDPVAFQRTYFEHLAQAAESGLFDTLAHPDLIKNMTPGAWDFDRIAPDIARALDRIAATGVAMELNTSGLNKAVAEMNPGREMLALMHERGIPVVLGADAHVPSRVGDRYGEALVLLQEIGFSAVYVYLERQRHPILIVDALASLPAGS